MYRFRRFGAALAVIVAPAIASNAAEMGFWSTPASAGIVDEDSASRVIFHDSGSAAIRPGVASGTVKLRYPVTHGPAQFDGFDAAACMKLSVRDTGPTARVIVQLVAIDAASGARTVLGSFDSDERFSTGSDQYRATGACSFRRPDVVDSLQGFDHAKYSYYIDVTLIRTDSSGNPGIKHIGLTVVSG